MINVECEQANKIQADIETLTNSSVQKSDP